MPETPEEFYARAAGALRTRPVETWDTWPLEGAAQSRPLAPPVEKEAPRQGEGGLPPTPEDVWRANIAAVVDALDAS